MQCPLIARFLLSLWQLHPEGQRNFVLELKDKLKLLLIPCSPEISNCFWSNKYRKTSSVFSHTQQLYRRFDFKLLRNPETGMRYATILLGTTVGDICHI